MQTYNPTIHHRRSIRLKGYDYSQAGLYFITICCQNKVCRFGKIVKREMILNDFGKIACEEWIKLSERYPNILLDVFQIMPNHVHGVIVLNGDGVGATLAVAQYENAVAQYDRAGASPARTIDQNDGAIQRAGANVGATLAVAQNNTIGNIVGAYKSLVVNQCLKICKSHNKYMGKLWHRNYWEHIVRNEKSYQRIANYIINNPTKWENDKFYPK